MAKPIALRAAYELLTFSARQHIVYDNDLITPRTSSCLLRPFAVLGLSGCAWRDFGGFAARGGDCLTIALCEGRGELLAVGKLSDTAAL